MADEPDTSSRRYRGCLVGNPQSVSEKTPDSRVLRLASEAKARSRLCHRYGNDTTQLSELYIARGKRAPAKIGRKTMSVLSAYPAWSSLREQPFDLNIAKFKQLVEVVSAAAQQNELIESTGGGHHA